MDEVFSRYLDPAFRYVRSQNPARVRSRQDALRDGLPRFRDYDRYRRVYAIRRLRPQFRRPGPPLH